LPVGPGNNPRVSIVLSETPAGITYRAVSSPLAAGNYHVYITRWQCSPEHAVANLGTFTSTGAKSEWTFDGKLAGKAPEGGLLSLVDRFYVAIVPEGATQALACGMLFAQ
jgi:hypothetical protein